MTDKKPWQKQALFLKNTEGYSNRKIAKILGKDESVIRRYLNKQGTSLITEVEETQEGLVAAIEAQGHNLHYATPSQQNFLEEVAFTTLAGVRTGGYGHNKTDPIRMKPLRLQDNSRILVVSDLHIPYHHKDAVEFLSYLKDKYKPTRVICMGDELDKHSLSFHDSDPDLPSAGDELRLALPVITQIKELFPVMDILESNHGSMVYRKAHANGIPKHYLKSYNDVLGVDENWKWHYEMVVDLPNGNKCYFHHGKSANVTKTSQTMSMCSVPGHFHESFKVEYWGNPIALYWAMQTGCLIDDKSYAFNYNNVNLKRPIIGTGLIIDSQPVLEPMVLDNEGRWINRQKIYPLGCC